MGEPLTTYTELQPSHRSFAPLDDNEPNVNGEEEPYTIKCICGFDDDAFDGATVFCEQCNTWQHIACYYATTVLADDAEHSCIDCKPNQKVDPRAATQRQEALRLPHALEDDRKNKRTNNKSHRKSKTRDLNNNAVQINGYILQDGRSGSPSAGSPRDSAPPAKKPKTSHRPSASLTNGYGRSTNGRHRSASVTFTIPDAPPKLDIDQCPPHFLSPEFIRVHRENTEFNPAPANLHLTISVTTLLSTWLDDQDAFLEATNGRTHRDVFMQFPESIEELETPTQKRVHEEPHVQFHGATPRWPYLTVDRDLVENDFVGELRGCIGRREDYQSDPVNQWNKLRHPDHFVFFHPELPIYIDARQEGTILRYARRSCRPNLKMRTIITGAREYRFCFTATQDIPKDSEITIAWDTQYDTQLQSALSKSPRSLDDFLYVCDFFGANLAHFGGCACENQHVEGRCLLAKFDRRASKDFPNGLISENKGKRKRGTKKNLAQVSTHGSTSRESSEEVNGNHDGDVDMVDGRSTSQSTKSSRDATPSTNPRSSSTMNGNQLSERDKKKLAQQEKFFERMEHDRQVPPPKKKKRNSGSNANTPTIPSHRANGRSIFSPSNPATPVSSSKQPFAPPHRSPPTRSPSVSNAARTSQQTKTCVQAIKPVYVDASTQTSPESTPLSPSSTSPKKSLPRSTQLLKRSLFRSRRQREMQTGGEDAKPPPPPSAASSPPNSQAMDTESSNSESPRSPVQSLKLFKPPVTDDPVSHQSITDEEQASVNDVNMPDVSSRVEDNTNDATDTKPFEEVPTAPVLNANSSEPVKPGPPPWPVISPKKEDDLEPAPLAAPIAPMHIDLPPNDFLKPPTPGNQSTSKTLGNMEEQAHNAPPGVTQPHALTIPPPHMRSSEVNSNTKPSPVKKKMSLSDYMSKRNKPSASADKTPTPGAQGTPPSSSGLAETHNVQSPDALDEAKA